MKAQEIRETFLDFFHQKDHKIVKSSSLLPKDDPTLLFTNAGMNQFKNVFLGLEKRSYKRAVSVQKCMRVSGKHNDLEQVGRTNKHHTFFEMLGNFSFGDYFKEKAISFAWELMTGIFRFPKERLYATVYSEDEEAYRIWNKNIGLPEDKIFHFGKKDNYWAMGEVGPCGPCSEIHFDLVPQLEEGEPRSLIERGSDRFLELWNLVFMQFYQDERRTLHPLPSPSIDTGMGLERIAASLQEKTSNFSTDLFKPIIQAISDFARKEYIDDEENAISFRIIADHVRAISFLIGDGIMPSNEGRGYVLRRLIRRAFRQGNFIGLEEPFIYQLLGVVCDVMKDAYPELLESARFISQVCLSEEQRFYQTLHSGMKPFQSYIEELEKTKKRILPGNKLFKLYDTFGFPLDLSRELAEEKGFAVDEKGFQQELEKQRERARKTWKGDLQQKRKAVYEPLKDLKTSFLGYERINLPDGKVLTLIRKGKIVDSLKQGEEGEVILEETPFYAEAGGQTGDAGTLKNAYFSAKVKETYYPLPELISHKVEVISGKLYPGDQVEAFVNLSRRMNISRNHTATHLLHAALRQSLGDHVKQSGSLVAADRFRFDFTHYAALSSSQLRQIEQLINAKIREDIPVEVRETSLEEGLKQGAVAIFEEKYGEKVRMIIIGEFSKELCGGIHVKSTGQIGLFKILSESSIAAGMRRIEAVTGEAALEYILEIENSFNQIRKSLNVPEEEVLNQIEKLKGNIKEKEKECQSLRQKMAQLRFGSGEEKIQQIKGISLYTQEVEGLNSSELRELADSIKQKLDSVIVVLGTTSGGKAFVVVSVSKDLTSRVPANSLIKKIAPIIGGGGGGRPDFAQSGGKKASNLKIALKKVPLLLEEVMAE